MDHYWGNSKDTSGQSFSATNKASQVVNGHNAAGGAYALKEPVPVREYA